MKNPATKSLVPSDSKNPALTGTGNTTGARKIFDLPFPFSFVRLAEPLAPEFDEEANAIDGSSAF